jgi:N-methylhydantoinase A/oxoprolinase/acetone carboxylase beta subunit
MGYSLGVDTGGTYTDAVIIDGAAKTVLGSAKALTTRSDLAVGIGGAVDGALASAGVAPGDIGLVSLSTTLATNALVEGRGGSVALIAIGFDAKDLARGGLPLALGTDLLIIVAGGHGHSGAEAAPLDDAQLRAKLARLGGGVAGFAVVARFATRNPAHEIRARDIIRAATGLPVTCSHELSSRLNGPKRALTAVLNARLIGQITHLVAACERYLTSAGITVPLMVVRGDGALISAEMAREHPIETILSGPAASIVGAHWLTGERNALVADIGGTTTDVALLQNGLPSIDPQGALVGGHRTMVEAVAMRTTGLGGDSELHLEDAGLRLGPRRLMPLSLLAVDHPDMVHAALDRALNDDAGPDHAGRFVLPMGDNPGGLAPRDAALLTRITAPTPLAGLLKSRIEAPALDRLVARGLVMLAGVTPSDAAHVLGDLAVWDTHAARKGIEILRRKRAANGTRRAENATAFAHAIVDQLTGQTTLCLLEAGFAEDPEFAEDSSTALARHKLTQTGLGTHRGIIEISARIAVPVIGLGASAPNYYRAVGARLGCAMVLPDHAGVANAIGAVVGQISERASGTVTSQGAGRFTAHLSGGPAHFPDRDSALAALEAALTLDASSRASRAGAGHLSTSKRCDIREAEIEGSPVFIEASMTITAAGRPAIAKFS